MIFINDLSPEMVRLGSFAIRWYGLLFSSGIIVNYLLLRWIFKREKYPVIDLDSVITYLFFGLIIGARLGEVLFYEPGFYFREPLEILKVWNGGLSSHGATIGIFISYVLWTRVHKVKFTKYADVLVLGMPGTAAFVRTGNFFNSEIVGIPTGGNWGVVFHRLGEDFPRHPVQLYEAILSITVLAILIYIYKRFYRKTPSLFFLFLYMILYFGGRFVFEFWKDLHVLPGWFPLSMGQILSIVPILMAVGYFLFVFPGQERKRQ